MTLAPTPGPIVFLDLSVVLPILTPTAVGGFAVRGIRNAPPLPNGSIERLNDFCKSICAAIALTSLAGYDDPRRPLFRLGLKVTFPAAWITDQTLDIAGGITAWLAANANPTCVVIGRPGIGPAGLPRIDVATGAEITVAAYSAAASEIANV